MYRVLARKYRPQTFADLIGQDVLVRTLTNAFASGRIAQAFLLTGIRGIGKTTTARIIAKGLNCTGPDGQGGPTTEPCGVCSNCIAITEGRHVDVIEMDAASHTGVEDVRSLIDSVQYAPAAGRYKVYIIDEVHMLSKSAFNALLKTLEEPPPHVKFIFATTEIRKIPVTIISRCQRFDLRRVAIDTLAAHLVKVAAAEEVALPEDCALLLAAVSEGSVRDGLSLLDQAIALHTDAAGNVALTAESLRDMLGLADKTQLFVLLSLIFGGAMDEALAELRRLHAQGADAAILLSDLLDIVHYLTRICVAPALASNLQFSPAEQKLGTDMAATLSVPALTRAWQILTRGYDEMRHTASELATLEMVLVRLGYAAQLPTPAELSRALASGAAITLPPGGRATSASVHSMASAVGASAAPAISKAPATVMSAAAPKLESQPQPQFVTATNYEEVVALFEMRREAMLASHLVGDLRLVRFAPGRIEVRPVAHINADVPARIARALKEWTGIAWSLTFSEEEGEPTLREQRASARGKARDYAASHPKVRAALDIFPEASVVDFVPEKKEP